MSKVYIVYSVDDPYCGIIVQAVFSNELAAKTYIDWFNNKNELAKKYDMCKLDYFAEEVLDVFLEEGK